MKKINIENFTGFYYYEFDKGYVFEGHTHPAWEINIVLDGEMIVTYGENILSLSKGDFFVGEPWVFHCNRAIGENAKMAVIQFLSENSDKGGFSVRKLTNDEFCIAKLIISEFYNICLKNGKIYDGGNEIYADVRKLCEVLLSRVHGINTAAENDSYRARIYRDTVKYMENNVSKKLTIDDISKEMHLSASFIKKIFFEFTGGGVINYFTHIKIKYAKKLLEIEKSVCFVSDTLGFSSQCYFSSLFKKIVGITPKKYQSLHLSKAAKRYEKKSF